MHYRWSSHLMKWTVLVSSLSKVKFWARLSSRSPRVASSFLLKIPIVHWGRDVDHSHIGSSFQNNCPILAFVIDKDSVHHCWSDPFLDHHSIGVRVASSRMIHVLKCYLLYHHPWQLSLIHLCGDRAYHLVIMCFSDLVNLSIDAQLDLVILSLLWWSLFPFLELEISFKHHWFLPNHLLSQSFFGDPRCR